ncbi:sensor histidine kinase [Marmoricola sp. URHB0036]|uniref:sensor histidine kinase n=1 Tax=Marmoricola sp. URHB0036 TaxID=1298863 RepID=UPI000482DC7F|nr:histidine kinase [Marmoricola sp. URHB0036]
MPVSLTAQFDPALLDRVGPRTTRDWLVDTIGFLVAVTFGVLILIQGVHDTVDPLTGSQLVIDAVCGAISCLALWWRRRWPLGVALLCVVLGVFSASATIAGLLALSSLAVHRSVRQVLFVAVLWIPQSIGYAIYSGRTDAPTVLLLALAMVLAATAWGMFVRARRQLLHTLRERALRAEADQLLHTENARQAERTRIAREMHDVLAHRISLITLHAGGLEVRPDQSTEKVRETAVLLRSTARQALEELRDVIGVLREEPGHEVAAAPQPTLSDIPRLVEETRQAGAKIDFEMWVDHVDTAPSALGRDAYRIVQEALTNIGKHARDTAGRVRVRGAAGSGLHVSVSNPLPVHTHPGPALPGSGAGLLGLQERVTLAGGTLVHGPDGSGDFVVDAELRW